MLNFAHNVVADMADHSALQRWQLGHHRCAMRCQHCFEGHQKTFVARHRCRHCTTHSHLAVDQRNFGTWSTTNKTESRPTFTVLDRLEQKAWLITDESQECTHGRVAICQHFGPHKAFGHLRSGRNQDATTRAAVAVIHWDLHQQTIIQHADRKFFVARHLGQATDERLCHGQPSQPWLAPP